jgi:pyruvate dehydrogenase E1 component beta subunit
MATILGSVLRTHRALIVHEAVRTGGAGAEIAARIMEEAFYALEAPVWRLGAVDAPIPQDPELEELCVPQVEGIADAIRALVRCEQPGDGN